jgi:hypothetical protein
MIDIIDVLWMFVIVFALMGFVRGWAREILVTASVILAYFIIFVLENLDPLTGFLSFGQSVGSEVMTMQQFWFRVSILGLLVFFGYQTPSIQRIAGNRFRRENFRDSTLGTIFGAFNGYLIFGSLWAFLKGANYPYEIVIQDFSEAAEVWMTRLPPEWLLQAPHIYIAVMIIFLFIIVVFV